MGGCNREGYPDPTAGIAIGRVMKQEKCKKKEVKKEIVKKMVNEEKKETQKEVKEEKKEVKKEKMEKEVKVYGEQTEEVEL